MVDKKSKIVFISMIVLALISILATYYKFVVLKDFEIINDIGEVSIKIHQICNLV